MWAPSDITAYQTRQQQKAQTKHRQQDLGSHHAMYLKDI